MYDWVFDKSKLKDLWPGQSGRVAAKKTLTDWGNVALPVYVKNQYCDEGQSVKEFSTFGDRVKEILFLLDLLLDHHINVVAQDGIKFSQTLDLHKGIFGFDVLDFLQPRERITSRTARCDSWGDGWFDLLPAIGVLSIFGNGFGHLIRPNDGLR